MSTSGRRLAGVMLLFAAALAVLVLALMGVSALDPATRPRWVLLVDRSQSMPRTETDAAAAEMQAALGAAQVRRIDFAGTPRAAVPDPTQTDIEAALAERGYAALLANAQGEAPHQQAIVDQLIGRRVDGLILATARRQDPVLSHCLAAGVPTVLVNRAEDGARAPSVVSDDAGGMRLAVEHLTALGHVRIGHLAGPEDLSTGMVRRQGFAVAMREAGLAAASVAVATAFTREAGRAAMAELLRAAELTAVVAANDLLALGAYQELAGRGLDCPRDVSIVGHNDMPLVDMVAPPLTTVRIDHHTMGQEAARLVMARIEAELEQPLVRTTTVRLVVRASTAAPQPSRSVPFAGERP